MLRRLLSAAILCLLTLGVANANSISNVVVGVGTPFNNNASFSAPFSSTPTLASGVLTVQYAATTAVYPITSLVNTTLFVGTGSTFNGTGLVVQGSSTAYGASCPAGVCTLVLAGTGSGVYTSGGKIAPDNFGDTEFETWASDGNVYMGQNDGSAFATLGTHTAVGVMPTPITSASLPPTNVGVMPHFQWGQGPFTAKGGGMIAIGTGGTDELYYSFYPQVYNFPYDGQVFTNEAPTIISSANHGVTWGPDPSTGGQGSTSGQPNNLFGAGLPITAAILNNSVEMISFTSTAAAPNATFHVGDIIWYEGPTPYAGWGSVLVPATCVSNACTGLQFINQSNSGSSSVAISGSPVVIGLYSPTTYTGGTGAPATVTAPMWFDSSLEAPMPIHYGEGTSVTYSDGACCSGTLPDNAGSFVYWMSAGAPPTATSATPQISSSLTGDYIYLMRVPYGSGVGATPDIQNLNVAQWEYYCSGDGALNASWTFATTPGLLPTAGNGGGTGGSGRSACNATPVMTDLNPQGANNNVGANGKLSIADTQYIPPNTSGGPNGGVYLSIMSAFTGALQPTQSGMAWSFGYIQSGGSFPTTLVSGAEAVTFGCPAGAVFPVGQPVIISGVSPSSYNTGNLGANVTSEVNNGNGTCTINVTNGASTATYVSGGNVSPSYPLNTNADSIWFMWQAPKPWGPWCKFEVQPFSGAGVDWSWYLPGFATPTLSADRTVLDVIVAASAPNYAPNLVPLTISYNSSSSGNLCGF